MRTRALLTSFAVPALLIFAAGSGPCGSLDMGSEHCVTNGDCGVLLCCNGACASTCPNDAGNGPSGTTTGGSSSTSTSGTSTSTGSGTSGNTTGGSSSGGGSTGGASTTGSSSSGGQSPGPYVGYDAGPATGPLVDVDAGCNASRPIYIAQYGQCFQCLTSADCANGLVCDLPSYTCQACSLFSNEGCPSGLVCGHGTNGATACIPPCADAGPMACNPGVCKVFTSDGGSYSECDHTTCTTDSDCIVDGGGVCNLSEFSSFQCMACRSDGGGCTTPGDVCDSNSPVPYCQLNCFTNPDACPPGTFCGAGGICMPGCQSSSDCGGAAPVCNTAQGGGCVACLTGADCPDFAPGCASYYECGYCADNSVCAGQHCSEGVCSCQSDSECPADAPICIGLDGGTSGLPPLCGCTDSSQCQTGYVCETRNGNFPRSIAAGGGNGIYSGVGGICLPACNQPGAASCTSMAVGAGTPYPSLECNANTGYCVECLQDADCPSDKPNCLFFPDGGLDGVQSGVAIATGGGVCGCSGTAACTNDDICVSAATLLDGPPTCEPACTVGGGPNACSSGSTAPFCDSWTGQCVGCLGDYDCTGALSTFNSAPTSSCDTSRDVCIQCRHSSECPARLPGCSTDPATEGTCGYCQSANDCPSGAGYECAPVQMLNPVCVIPCVPGDDAGLGTVSDAGLACPNAQPYCVQLFNLAPVDGGYQFFCSECLSVGGSPFDTQGTCDSGYCAGTFCVP